MPLYLEDSELVETVALFCDQENKERPPPSPSSYPIRLGKLASFALGLPSKWYGSTRKELPQRSDLAMKAKQRLAFTGSEATTDPSMLQLPEEGLQYVVLPPGPFEDMHEADNNVIYFGVWGTCIPIYGAIHLAAWNIQFPSVVEQWLWRCAAISLSGYFYILGVGIGTVIMVHATIVRIREVGYKRAWSRDSWREFVERFRAGPGRRYFVLMSICISVLFLLARIVILVEIFLSLRSSPAGAYDSVDWSSFFAHFEG